jgi:hypothetical protein
MPNCIGHFAFFTVKIKKVDFSALDAASATDFSIRQAFGRTSSWILEGATDEAAAFGRLQIVL